MRQHCLHTYSHTNIYSVHLLQQISSKNFIFSHMLKAGKENTLINRVWSSSLNFPLFIFLCPVWGKSCFSSPNVLWPKGQAASGTVSENSFNKSCCVVTGAVTRKEEKKKLLQSNIFKSHTSSFVLPLPDSGGI